MLCRSHQQEPPPLFFYASRPIISPSLGIDQRAGESPVWGREGGAHPTSARSTERFSVRRKEGTPGVQLGAPVIVLLVDCITAQKVMVITLQQQVIGGRISLIHKNVQMKCASVGPTRSGLCIFFTTKQMFRCEDKEETWKGRGHAVPTVAVAQVTFFSRHLTCSSSHVGMSVHMSVLNAEQIITRWKELSSLRLHDG